MHFNHLVVYFLCVLFDVFRCDAKDTATDRFSHNCTISARCVIATYDLPTNYSLPCPESGVPKSTKNISLHLSSGTCFNKDDQPAKSGWLFLRPWQWIPECWNRWDCTVQVDRHRKSTQVGVLVCITGRSPSWVVMSVHDNRNFEGDVGDKNREEFLKLTVTKKKIPDFDFLKDRIPRNFYNQLVEFDNREKARQRRHIILFGQNDKDDDSDSDYNDDEAYYDMFPFGVYKHTSPVEDDDDDDIDQTDSLLPVEDDLWGSDDDESVSDLTGLHFADDYLDGIPNDLDLPAPAGARQRTRTKATKAKGWEASRGEKTQRGKDLQQKISIQGKSETKSVSNAGGKKAKETSKEETIVVTEDGKAKAVAETSSQQSNDFSAYPLSLSDGTDSRVETKLSISTNQNTATLASDLEERLRVVLGKLINGKHASSEGRLAIKDVLDSDSESDSEEVDSDDFNEEITALATSLKKANAKQAAVIRKPTPTTTTTTKKPPKARIPPPSTPATTTTKAPPPPVAPPQVLATNIGLPPSPQSNEELARQLHDMVIKNISTSMSNLKVTEQNIMRAENILLSSLQALRKNLKRLMTKSTPRMQKKLLRQLEASMRNATYAAAWSMIREVVMDPKQQARALGLEWFEWGAWSSCSAKCESIGYKLRRRYCKPGGLCTGPSFDLMSCRSEAICRARWLEWSVWSTCSASCGNGWRTRSRICLTDRLDKPCLGNAFENGQCPSQPPCQQPKMPPSSPQPTAGVRQPANQGSTTVKAKKPVEIDEEIKVKLKKPKKKHKHPAKKLEQEETEEEGEEDQDTGEKSSNSEWVEPLESKGVEPLPRKHYVGEDQWSPWGVWSMCTVTCGPGKQERKRMCTRMRGNSLEGHAVSDKNCHGASSDRRVCSMVPCNHKVAVKTKLLKAPQGSKANLTCNYNSTLPVKEVYWINPQGERINKNTEDERFIVINNTLTITKVNTSDLGEYHCVLIGMNENDEEEAEELAATTCAALPCKHGGVCEEVQDQRHEGAYHFRCICKDGYYGRHCQQKFAVADHLPWLKMLAILLLLLILILVTVSVSMCVYYRFQDDNDTNHQFVPVSLRRRSEDVWRNMKPFDKPASGSLTSAPGNKTLPKEARSSPDSHVRFGIEESPYNELVSSLVNADPAGAEVTEHDYKKFDDERLTSNLKEPSALEMEVMDLLKDDKTSPPSNGVSVNSSYPEFKNIPRSEIQPPPPELKVHQMGMYGDKTKPHSWNMPSGEDRRLYRAAGGIFDSSSASSVNVGGRGSITGSVLELTPSMVGSSRYCPSITSSGSSHAKLAAPGSVGKVEAFKSASSRTSEQISVSKNEVMDYYSSRSQLTTIPSSKELTTVSLPAGGDHILDPTYSRSKGPSAASLSKAEIRSQAGSGTQRKSSDILASHTVASGLSCSTLGNTTTVRSYGTPLSDSSMKKQTSGRSLDMATSSSAFPKETSTESHARRCETRGSVNSFTSSSRSKQAETREDRILPKPEEVIGRAAADQDRRKVSYTERIFREDFENERYPLPVHSQERAGPSVSGSSGKSSLPSRVTDISHVTSASGTSQASRSDALKHMEGGGEGVGPNMTRSDELKSPREALLRRAMENSFVKATTGFCPAQSPVPVIQSLLHPALQRRPAARKSDSKLVGDKAEGRRHDSDDLHQVDVSWLENNDPQALASQNIISTPKRSVSEATQESRRFWRSQTSDGSSSSAVASPFLSGSSVMEKSKSTSHLQQMASPGASLPTPVKKVRSMVATQKKVKRRLLSGSPVTQHRNSPKGKAFSRDSKLPLPFTTYSGKSSSSGRLSRTPNRKPSGEAVTRRKSEGADDALDDSTHSIQWESPVGSSSFNQTNSATPMSDRSVVLSDSKYSTDGISQNKDSLYGVDPHQVLSKGSVGGTQTLPGQLEKSDSEYASASRSSLNSEHLLPSPKPALKSLLKHVTPPSGSHNPDKISPGSGRRVSFGEPDVREFECVQEDVDAAFEEISKREEGPLATEREFEAISLRPEGPLATERLFDDIGKRPGGPLDHSLKVRERPPGASRTDPKDQRLHGRESYVEGDVQDPSSAAAASVKRPNVKRRAASSDRRRSDESKQKPHAQFSSPQPCQRKVVPPRFKGGSPCPGRPPRQGMRGTSEGSISNREQSWHGRTSNVAGVPAEGGVGDHNLECRSAEVRPTLSLTGSPRTVITSTSEELARATMPRESFQRLLAQRKPNAFFKPISS